MFRGASPKAVGRALLVGGLITGAAFAAAPIASADKVDDVFRCNDNGSSFKDCCDKAGGDYVKHSNGAETCTFLDTKTQIARNINTGELHVLGIDGSPPPPPTGKSAVPRPPQQQSTQ